MVCPAFKGFDDGTRNNEKTDDECGREEEENESENKMSRAMWKCVLCHMRPTKAQISLRIW